MRSGLLDTGVRGRNTTRIDTNFTLQVLENEEFEPEESDNMPPPRFKTIRSANDGPRISELQARLCAHRELNPIQSGSLSAHAICKGF